jgi:hypothetical protein
MNTQTIENAAAAAGIIEEQYTTLNAARDKLEHSL